ncbi:MAG: hypothetical protein U9N84_05995 [Actinomycetota bacterium]|nr:hypothetical protein [Actinomycetota bacterium]
MVTDSIRTRRGTRARLVARIAAFTAAALLVPAINLGALGLGWAATLEDKGRDGIPLAVMWSIAALLVNFVLYAIVIEPRYG